MFCPKCGVELPDEYKFCLKCGFAIPQEVQQENDVSEQSEVNISSNTPTETTVNESKFHQCLRCGGKRCQPHFSTNNTLMWFCPDCDLVFREHQETFNAIVISEKFFIGSLIALLFCVAVFSSSVYLGPLFLICAILLAPICLWGPYHVYKDAVENQFFVLTDQEKEQLRKTRMILYGVLVVMLFVSFVMFFS